MNKINNKKRKTSQEKIEKCFIELIQKKDITNISVTDICKQAKLNRTTFYSNYIDIYDLADKIKDSLCKDILNVYDKERNERSHSFDFLKLFNHIKENQIFYTTFFKLNYDNDYKQFKDFMDYDLFKKLYNDEAELDYHISFFMSGLNAIIKKWIKNGCKESPEFINNILKTEYKNQRYI